MPRPPSETRGRARALQALYAWDVRGERDLGRIATRVWDDHEVSPDERSLGFVYSYSTKPHEVFLMPNTSGAAAKQVTTSPTEEWLSFKWIDPQLLTYKARDGVEIPARLYTPEMIGARRDPSAPAVVFNTVSAADTTP